MKQKGTYHATETQKEAFPPENVSILNENAEAKGAPGRWFKCNFKWAVADTSDIPLIKRKIFSPD